VGSVAGGRAAVTAQSSFSSADGLRYGLLGLPLAFVALPLYVILPNHYAREFGVPLAALGAVLLAARLFDAVIDPWIGRLNDRLFARSAASVLALGAVAALLLVGGFALLFFPLTRQPMALLAWAGAALVVTYAGYSALSVAHQAWGARLGGDESQRGRIVAWREGLGLAGVLLASVISVVAGPLVATAALAIALGAGWLAWARSRRPPPSLQEAASFNLWLPLARPAFRRLLAVFLLNGIASAIPATLVLFYVQDRLQAPAALQPAFLGSYFLCAALAMPLWLAAVRRIGLARSWLCGMALAIAVFIWAAMLGPGDSASFLAVCVLSGAALGADLALPGALLAGLIADAGERGRAEGAYFGWWNFATKLNLALAAGMALPVLALFGYAPGARDAAALQALVLAYCLLPCMLKACAATVLYVTMIRGRPWR
jgi:glycoside/pentoside/hexuronide:cation symporter, GPH family